MPGAVIPLIAAGVSATGSIAGAKIAAGGAQDAAATQANAANRAAALEQQNLQQSRAFAAPLQQAANASYSPYVQMGQQSLRNLGYSGPLTNTSPLLTLAQAGYQTPTSPPPPGYGVGFDRPDPAPGMAAAPTVMMRAPTGQVQRVPAAQQAHYEALGAVRVS